MFKLCKWDYPIASVFWLEFASRIWREFGNISETWCRDLSKWYNTSNNVSYVSYFVVFRENNSTFCVSKIWLLYVTLYWEKIQKVQEFLCRKLDSRFIYLFVFKLGDFNASVLLFHSIDCSENYLTKEQTIAYWLAKVNITEAEQWKENNRNWWFEKNLRKWWAINCFLFIVENSVAHTKVFVKLFVKFFFYHGYTYSRLCFIFFYLFNIYCCNFKIPK